MPLERKSSWAKKQRSKNRNMKTPLLHGLLFVGCLLLRSVPSIAAESATAQNKNTYVIVHGALGGGWDWKNVAQLLSADGNIVYRPTLTGLGERAHLSSPNIGLSTHVNDVVNVILYEDLHDIVLVGHSYAGMVITGLIDRVPERIKHVIYLDAFIPEDGESANECYRVLGVPPFPTDGTEEVRDNGPNQRLKVSNGFISLVGVDPHAPPPLESPQPLRTWTEPVSFKNPTAKGLRGSAVWFLNKGAPHTLAGILFEPFGHRAEARGWKTLYLESDHYAERSHPRELAKLLEQIMRSAAEPDQRPQQQRP